MKTPLEYSRFATISIHVAQLLAGLLAIVSSIRGFLRLLSDFGDGLLSIVAGLVLLGVFFALARVQNIKDRDQDG